MQELLIDCVHKIQSCWCPSGSADSDFLCFLLKLVASLLRIDNGG